MLSSSWSYYQSYYLDGGDGDFIFFEIDGVVQVDAVDGVLLVDRNSFEHVVPLWRVTNGIFHLAGASRFAGFQCAAFFHLYLVDPGGGCE